MLCSGKKSEELVPQQVHISRSRGCCHCSWIAAKVNFCIYVVVQSLNALGNKLLKKRAVSWDFFPCLARVQSAITY